MTTDEVEIVRLRRDALGMRAWVAATLGGSSGACILDGGGVVIEFDRERRGLLLSIRVEEDVDDRGLALLASLGQLDSSDVDTEEWRLTIDRRRASSLWVIARLLATPIALGDGDDVITTFDLERAMALALLEGDYVPHNGEWTLPLPTDSAAFMAHGPARERVPHLRADAARALRERLADTTGRTRSHPKVANTSAVVETASIGVSFDPVAGRTRVEVGQPLHVPLVIEAKDTSGMTIGLCRVLPDPHPTVLVPTAFDVPVSALLFSDPGLSASRVEAGRLANQPPSGTPVDWEEVARAWFSGGDDHRAAEALLRAAGASGDAVEAGRLRALAQMVTWPAVPVPGLGFLTAMLGGAPQVHGGGKVVSLRIHGCRENQWSALGELQAMP